MAKPKPRPHCNQFTQPAEEQETFQKPNTGPSVHGSRSSVRFSHTCIRKSSIHCTPYMQFIFHFYIRSWSQSHFCCPPCFGKFQEAGYHPIALWDAVASDVYSGRVLELFTRVHHPGHSCVLQSSSLSCTAYYLLLFHQDQYTSRIQYRHSLWLRNVGIFSSLEEGVYWTIKNIIQLVSTELILLPSPHYKCIFI